MPLELQRCVSQLREVDIQTQGKMLTNYSNEIFLVPAISILTC